MARTALFDHLGEQERAALLSASRRRTFRRGEVIFHAGDPGDTLHVLVKGHVAITVTTPLGDTAMLAVLGPGSAFGEQALLVTHARRTATAAALEPVETRSLHRDTFDDLRRRSPQIDRFLVEMLASELERVSSHLVEALYVPAETRVLRRLLVLAEQYRDERPATNGDVPAEPAVIPITQDDLATLAGTTRPTANRVLRAAEDAGLVALRRGRIAVLDPAALAHRAR